MKLRSIAAALLVIAAGNAEAGPGRAPTSKGIRGTSGYDTLNGRNSTGKYGSPFPYEQRMRNHLRGVFGIHGDVGAFNENLSDNRGGTLGSGGRKN